MNKKTNFMIITDSAILFLFFTIFVFNINDGYSGKRGITKTEKEEIIVFLENYYRANNREEYVFTNEICKKYFFIPKPAEVVLNWEILDSSFFVKHIFDNPIDNQYIINVSVKYSNEKYYIEETFHLINEEGKWKILWLYT